MRRLFLFYYSPEKVIAMFPIKIEIDGRIIPASIAEVVPPNSKTLSNRDRFLKSLVIGKVLVIIYFFLLLKQI